MRKQLSMLLCIAMLSISSFAQTRQVSGQIKDEKGQPIPYATIKLKGAKGATSADQNGNFKIEVTGAKPSLLVTAAGFDASELAVGENGSVGVVLKSQSSMNEVVVTALGIKRNKNVLPYAAQQISGDQVSATRSNNFVTSLSGKISGLEVRQGNAMGASTNVVIRGAKSFLSSNQALFVIDGVPVDNSNNNSANKSTTTSNDQTSGRGGYDYGNAAADINPDDIESITVLKGAASTALYGSRAANGVVMITTKKSKRGLGIVVNTGVTVGKIDKSTFTKYQKEYGAGYQQGGYSTTASGSPNTSFWWKDAFGTGSNSLIVPTTEDASYGARFDPNLMVYHWDSFDSTSAFYKKQKPWVGADNDPVSFYETAIATNNSVFVDGGNDQASFKMGYTRTDERGVLPNSRLLKNLLNFGATYKVNDKLTLAGNINFSKIDGRGRYGTGYSKYNVNQAFRQWWETNVDVQELKDAYNRTGQNITWNWADPTKPSGLYPIYTDNPYFIRNKNYETDSRYRYFGNASVNYNVNSWLNVLGRVSLDSYDELEEERIAVGSVAVPSYSRFNRTFREFNYDLMASVNKDLNPSLNLKAVAGMNLRRNYVNSIYAITNGGLVVPDLYFLGNSVSPISAPTESDDKIFVDGYYANATLTYKELLSLDVSGRYDHSSTLPANNNTYFYPSISGSFNFSKLLPNATWLSSGKLRANYAEVGNSAPFSKLKDVYDKPTVFGNATLFSLPNTKNNPNLKPERTKSAEIGLEMAFFQNRFGLDVTYYDTKSVDQIFPVAVSTATGYSNKYVNAGTIRNRGVELSVFATPIKTKDFSWTINLNFTSNRNKVLALYDSSKNLQINQSSLQGGVSINATLGEPYGTIQGKTWNRYQPTGEKLVGANGYYSITSTTNNVIGNINPDWIGGIYNTFKYKNLSLGFLIDVRKGGDVFSLDLYYGMATGLYPETVGNNDLGNPKRAPLASGGGLIVPGVTADGKANTKRVDNTSYGYYGYVYNPAAAFVYDASYVKLRELNFTYSFPQSLISKTKVFKGIDLSVIGRNLWIIHKNLPYSDPEENLSAGNVQGYQSGAYPTTRSLGVNLKMKF
jgi:TonB-linked SusC/RagA family outer membrane protein